MKLKKIDKKGQGGPSISMLVGIALGVLVLVVAAIGWWSGANWFYSLFGLLPNPMVNEISRCQLIVDANQEILDATYCQIQKNIRTASGKRNINCEFKEITVKTKRSLDEKICKDEEIIFCDGKKIEFIEERVEEGNTPDAEVVTREIGKLKINDYTCVQVLDGTFVPPPVTPPVTTGSCVNSNQNLDCRNYNDDKAYCEGAGCVWDETKPDKCVSIIDCNSKTTSVACTAISGCTWTPNVA